MTVHWRHQVWKDDLLFWLSYVSSLVLSAFCWRPSRSASYGRRQCWDPSVWCCCCCVSSVLNTTCVAQPWCRGKTQCLSAEVATIINSSARRSRWTKAGRNQAWQTKGWRTTGWKHEQCREKNTSKTTHCERVHQQWWEWGQVHVHSTSWM